MRDLVGEVLSDRYELIDRVAGGGMGEVYRAHDQLLDRVVAVKMLQPRLATDPVLVERFRSEARAAARLTHPNIVAVHDWGSEGDHTYYMVMEYVAGDDLRDVLIGNGSLSPVQAAEIAVAVCDALAAAHAAGLVHRDIKPENVLISRTGIVKVADFGIAAFADADRTTPGATISGTLRYIAPEQAAGQSATPASDLWSTGAVLAEMLTGIPVQQGGGAELLRRRMTEEAEPPSERNHQVPAELDAVVLKACALDPSGRFRSAVEMGAALRRVLARSLPDPEPLDSLLSSATGEIRLDGERTHVDEPPLDAQERTGSVRRLFARVGVALVLLALVGAGIATAATSFGGPTKVRVPHLRGMSKDAATKKVEEAGLALAVVRRLYSFDQPAGRVIFQKPARGTRKEGATIAVTLSKGPRPARVPSLHGAQLGQAEVRLRASGLQLGDVRRRYSLEPAGTVIQQHPKPSKVRWGSTVDLVLSLGPRPVTLPEVVASSQERATQVLQQAGFHVTVASDYSNSVPAGHVISTIPPGNTTIDQGSTVTITVSRGPRYTELTLPDVRGMSKTKAVARLESNGLRVTVKSCGSGSRVVETDPIAGTMVREHDVVALFVCG